MKSKVSALTLSRKDQIIEILKTIKRGDINEIAKNSDFEKRQLSHSLKELAGCGHIIMKRQGRNFYYSLPNMSGQTMKELQEQINREIEIAERLEKAGYWRRASRQWLKVIDIDYDEKRKEEIAIRRQDCITYSYQWRPSGLY